MRFEKFSFAALEKKLEEIGPIENVIEFISYEMMRCKKTIQDIRSDVKNIYPTDIILTTKTYDGDNSFIEIINCDKEIKNAVTKEIAQLCGVKLCEYNEEFLEKAQFLMDHFQTTLDVKIKCQGYSRDGIDDNLGSIGNKKIIWRSGKEKLLKLFTNLQINEIIPDYTKEEILSHFVNDKHIHFCKKKRTLTKFSWKDSDSSFAIFVDELAKKGAIDDDGKFKSFSEHFINKKGTCFKNLPQKRNFTENTTKTGGFIKKIIEDAFLLTAIPYL